jgi:hypothetical protein
MLLSLHCRYAIPFCCRCWSLTNDENSILFSAHRFNDGLACKIKGDTILEINCLRWSNTNELEKAFVFLTHLKSWFGF